MIVRVFFFLSLRRTPRSTRTDILFPFTSLFRSAFLSWLGAGVAPQLPPSQSEPTIAYRPAFSVHPAHMGRAQSGPMVQSLCAVPDCEALFDTGGQGTAIGRASCRERVCQYVSISVVAVSLKKKNSEEYTTYKKQY